MGDTKPQVAAFADLDSGTLYALLRLRVDVFVVEQECPYPELDAGFYARYGFAVDGPEYVEDGIPHVPMIRR
jgi:predicted GNAT family N-acyltransferase